MQSTAETGRQLSIVRGEPLDETAAQGLTIAAFARDVTSRWAANEALVTYTASGVVRWSYADLWDRSMEIARALAATGVGKGTRVGILMTNRPEFVASVFGIALAGGVAVALNTFATAIELDYQLKASCIDTLLFECMVAKRNFAAMLEELEPALATAVPGKLVSRRFPFLRQIISLDHAGSKPMTGIARWKEFLQSGDTMTDEAIDARAVALAPSDMAILFFSSGSTGSPKGILHNQRAVVLQWHAWPRAMGFSGALRVWTANGFFWSGNFAMVIGSALSSGGAIVLQSTFDAAQALELMEKEHVNTPFAMLHQWGRIAAEPNFMQTDLSAVRFLEPKFVGLQHPTISTSYRQPQAFGCTETLTINTTTYFGEGGLTRYEGHGLPLSGNTIKIVDPISGEILPRGHRGEIAVKGPTLMLGYLGKTAEECFDDEGFYHSGDGGYLDESGWLFWEGRLTDIIKTGGANVSPMEVDDAINAHPGIKATQTVGLPHDTLGEIVVSCIVPHEGAKIDQAELLEFLKKRLASYKLPRRILILREDELTLTGSGNKIKAAEVRKLAEARFAAGGADRPG